MGKTAPDTAREVSAWECFRDRLAYLASTRERLLRGVFCGLAMAFAAGSACRIPTPLSAWWWLAALAVFGLALVRFRLGAAAMGCVCTIQALSLHGQLGAAAALLSVALATAGERRALRWCSLLAGPYLLRAGLGIAVPLGLALSANRRTAWLWVLLAFLWCLFHGFAVGQARLGVQPLPVFAQAGQRLGVPGMARPPGKPTAAPTSGKAPRTPPSKRTPPPRNAARTVAAAPSAQGLVPFNTDSLRRALAEASPRESREPLLQAAAGGRRNLLIAIQALVWCAIGAGARALYFHRRLKDRLALEYLEKVTRHTQHAATPVWRRLPAAVGAGTLGFVAAYLVLGTLSSEIQYGIPQVGLDVLSAALLLVPLWAGLEGDAHAGRETLAQRRASAAAGRGMAFKDLPIGGLEVSRRAAAATPARPAPEPASPARGEPRAGSEAAHNQPPQHRPLPDSRRPPAAAPTPAPVRPVVSAPGHAASAVEAVMFIDMVGSTAMGSRYGDTFVFRLKERLGQTVRAECRKQGVLFAKGTGDGFMLTFPEAENAVSAAMNILREVRRENAGVPEPRAVHLRMGIHMGEVNIDPQGDRIGTTANFAARIEGAKLEHLKAAEDPANVQLPEKDRILVSEVVHDELRDHPGFPMRPVGYFEFKGISGLHRIYEVLVN